MKFGQSPFEIFGNEHTDKMKVTLVIKCVEESQGPSYKVR